MSLPPYPPGLRPDPPLGILAEIAMVLADWPLYKAYRYKGDLWTDQGRGTFSFTLPQTVRIFCSDELCATVQVWEGVVTYLSFYSTSIDCFGEVSFRCRNCKRSQVTYFLHLVVIGSQGEITKVGQWPPLSREPDPVVSTGW